jgi:hypothetical protein
LTYPSSIIGYFVLGFAGACTFLFLLLIFDKEIAILRNKLVSLPWMIVIYAVLGGVLSVVVNLSGNPTFDAGQLMLAFSAGMGWPALATGVSAAKKVGEVNEAADKRVEKTAQQLDAIGDRKVSERDEFYKGKLEEQKQYFETMKNLLEKEIEDAKSYFAQRLSSKGGE